MKQILTYIQVMLNIKQTFIEHKIVILVRGIIHKLKLRLF